MANDDVRRGLVPSKHPNGNNWGVEYFLMDATASGVFKGDLLVLEADGKVNTWASTGASAEALLGVAAASRVTGTAATVPVYVDPNIVYEIQCDSVGVLNTAGIGSTCAVVTATPSSLGNSLYELDADSAAATYALFRPLTVVGFSDRVNSDGTSNDRSASHAKALVVLNKGVFGKTQENI